MSRTHLYADGIEQVTLLEGLVRMDLFCAGESVSENEVSHEPVGRLLLPPPAFLQAYEAMGQFIARLEEAGLVQRNDAAAVSSSQPGSESFSPNFD